MTARSLFRIIGATLFMIVALSTAAAPVVVSAGETGTICYSLPAKDCTILKTAEANVAQEKSFSADYAMTLALTGSGLSINSNAKGTLLLSYDPTAMNDLGMLLKKLQLDLEGTGTFNSKGLTPNTNQKGPFSLIYVDGIYYTQREPIGWVGTKFNGQTLDGSLSQTDAFWDALSQQSNPTIANAFREFVESPVIPKFFSSLPTIPNFVKLKKTANSPTLDGQKQIEFIYT
jgi:hypothetical protein